MEIIKHELLDTGSSKSFHYYSLTCGFDINPNNGGTSSDMFYRIREIISERSTIEDDIIMRVYKNSDEFNLSAYPTDDESVAYSQYVFSVPAHNDGWTSESMKEALAFSEFSTELQSKVGSIAIEWYQSKSNGTSVKILNETDGQYYAIDAWNLIYSKTAPSSIEDGSNGQVWVVSNIKGHLTYYYRENNAWLNITPVIVVGKTEPTSGERYWFDTTGLTCQYVIDLDNQYEGTSYEIEPETTDPQYINLVDTPRGTVFEKHNGTDFKYVPVDGNIVFDEYTWFSKDDEVVSDAFGVAEENSALAGAADGVAGGSMEIYNTSVDPANFVGVAEKLVINSALFSAFPTSEDGVVILGDPPSNSSHFTQNDGASGNQPLLKPATTTVYIPNAAADIVVGPWTGNPQQPALTDTTILSGTSGLVHGFGTGSTLTVTANDGTSDVAVATIVDNDTDATTTVNGVTLSVTGVVVEGSGFGGKIEITIDHSVLLAGNSSYLNITVSHTAADNGTEYSDDFTYFYDRNTSGQPPAINGPATFAPDITNLKTKQLSGITYMTTDQEFDFSVSDVDNLGHDSFSLGSVISIEPGQLPINRSGVVATDGALTGFTFDYDVTGVSYDKTLKVSQPGVTYIGNTDTRCDAKDPWTTVSKTIGMTNMLIDTVTETSTDLIENFDGESYRLNDAWTTWDSSLALTAGHGLVADNLLMSPSKLETTVGITANASDLTGYIPAGNPDYSGLTGTYNYRRKFTFTNPTQAFPNFSMSVTGDFGSHADVNAAMDAGDVEIYMIKVQDAEGTQTDPAVASRICWIHARFNTLSYDNGNTQTAVTAGCRLPTSSGSIINMSNGPFSLLQGFWLEIVINSDDISIDNITVNE